MRKWEGGIICKSKCQQKKCVAKVEEYADVKSKFVSAYSLSMLFSFKKVLRFQGG